MALRWSPSKLSDVTLAFLAILAIASFYFLEKSKHPVRSKYFDQKVAAAEKASKAFEVIRELRGQLGIPIDTINDPNKTGLIGHAFTVITTRRADLSEKLTSSDPNMAALMVQLLRDAGVDDGDTVLVSWTGSYPGINIALLAAFDVIGVKPVIITSLESSMWGANDPKLTWLDMERALRDAKLFDHRSAFATYGGDDDNGLGVPPDGIEAMRQAAERNGIRLFRGSSLDENIAVRMELASNAKVFINVGYNVASFGKPELRQRFGPGIYTHLPDELEVEKGGAALRLAAEGKKVINLVDINKLAMSYGLEPAQVPLKPIGKGALYYEQRYSLTLAVIIAVAIFILIYAFLRFDLPKYLLIR